MSINNKVITSNDLAAVLDEVLPSVVVTTKEITPDSVNCATTAIQKIADVSLEEGTWIIIYGGAFASNATGMRRMHFGTDTTMGRFSPTQPATNGDQTRMNATALMTVASTTTYSLYASQNSGSTLAFYGYIRAVKIVG